ncbi:MAG: hypothetical protein ACUVWX_09815 [Kiritimatiellia bacterium]
MQLVFVNEDADRNLILDGMTNAFYRYATFSSGQVANNLQGSILEPTGDPKFGKDGYHLYYGSPLMNRYSLLSRDPVTDVDGETRPHQTYADIGCDEAILPPQGRCLSCVSRFKEVAAVETFELEDEG